LATQTITTKRHSCDLCGQERQEDEFAHLYGPTAFPSREGPRVDICGDCQARPIAEVLALVAKAVNAVRVRVLSPAEVERSSEELAGLRKRLARLEAEQTA
jgi:hypothetical protein